MTPEQGGVRGVRQFLGAADPVVWTPQLKTHNSKFAFISKLNSSAALFRVSFAEALSPSPKPLRRLISQPLVAFGIDTCFMPRKTGVCAKVCDRGVPLAFVCGSPELRSGS